MHRNRDQQNQSNRQARQGDMGQDRHRDMQGGRSQEHQSSKSHWDGTERRTGADRRIEYGDMNEGSSR
jgi:hypothetical protein